MTKPRLIYLLIFFPFSLLAQQDLQTCWERSFLAGKDAPEKIHDAFLMPDGNLAMVGELKNPKKGKGKDAFFMIVDSKTGEQIARRDFSEFGDEVLKAVVWGDYSFFAVGYTEKGTQKGQNGWVLELDWLGENRVEILKDTTLGTEKKDEFSKIVWTDNSTALIGGARETHKGDVWIVNWDGQKATEKTVGAGRCKELVGMEKGIGGKIWLCGNTCESKDCDTWWMQIDETKIDYQCDFIGTKKWEKLYHASSSVHGSFTMTGESWKRRGTDGDMWLLEMDRDRNLLPEVLYGETDDEKITTVLKSPQGKYWTTVETLSAGFGLPEPSTKLAVWNEISMEEPIFQQKLQLPNDTELQAVRMIRTDDNRYILAGNLLKGKKRNSKIHLICWKNGSLLAAKGAKRLDNSEPKLVDRDRNGILSKNELGAIKFQLTNIGDVDIMEGRIIIEKEAVVDGLQLKREELFLSYLPVGGAQNYSIPLAGLANLATGKSKFSIKIMADDYQIHQFYATIQCGKPNTPLATNTNTKNVENKNSLDWKKPDVRLAGSRNVQVLEDGYEIQVNVNSNRPLKREDFKVSRNGITLIDNKSENGLLTTPWKDKDIFKYTFAYKVSGLEEGENVIEVRLKDDEKTTPIVINYQPIQPNLHILAIGPTYDDLKFSGKDANDFATAIAEQAGRGFFNEVFIEKMVDSIGTEKTKIAKAVKKLAKRTQNTDLKNHIKANDYVIFFFSGHGVKRTGRFKLLPTDYDPDFEEDTVIDYKDEILQPLTTIDSKVIVFIDACLSGHAKSSPSEKDLSDALLEANRTIPGIITISSCSKNQLSYEDPTWQNGAFTKALIEALNGETITLKSGEVIHPDLGLVDENGALIEDKNNRIIVIGELVDFLKKRVPDLVKDRIGESQVPDVPLEKLDPKLHLFTLK